MMPFAFQFSLDAFSDQEKLWTLVVLFVGILVLFGGALSQLRGVSLFDFLFPNTKASEEQKKAVTPFIKRHLLLFFALMLLMFFALNFSYVFRMPF